MGVFAPSDGVLPVKSKASDLVESMGLNQGGPLLLNKLGLRSAFVHDQRFSPNNAQIDLLYEGSELSTFFFVGIDDGRVCGNSQQFNGPDERVVTPRRTVVSFHVIPGSAEMKELLFRPCNQTNVEGFVETLSAAADQMQGKWPAAAEAARNLTRLLRGLIC